MSADRLVEYQAGQCQRQCKASNAGESKESKARNGDKVMSARDPITTAIRVAAPVFSRSFARQTHKVWPNMETRVWSLRMPPVWWGSVWRAPVWGLRVSLLTESPSTSPDVCYAAHAFPCSHDCVSVRKLPVERSTTGNNTVLRHRWSVSSVCHPTLRKSSSPEFGIYIRKPIRERGNV